MGLLASVNRAVATAEGTVSPFCQVVFLPGDDRYQADARVFTSPGESVPFTFPPMLLFGVDTTVLMEDMLKNAGPFIRGERDDVPESGLSDDDFKRRS